MNKRKYHISSSSKESRDMIVQKIKEKEGEKRVVTMAIFKKTMHSSEMGCTSKKNKHNNIINASKAQLSFLIKTVYDLLQTPANTSKWFNR